MLPYHLREECLDFLMDRVDVYFLPDQVEIDDEVFAEWLIHKMGWEQEKAEKIFDLTDDEVWTWSDEEIDYLVESLGIDDGLFKMLVNPTSFEVLQHALITYEIGVPEEDLCPMCQNLPEKARAAEDLEALQHLAMHLTTHIEVGDEEDLLHLEDEIGPLQEIIRIYAQLPMSARHRLLAHAYRELETMDDEVEDPLTLLYLWREEYLNADQRAFLDRAVLAEDGSETFPAPSQESSSVASKAELTGESFQASIRLFRRETGAHDYDSFPTPFKLVKRGETTKFSLKPEPLFLLRAILKAESNDSSGE